MNLPIWPSQPVPDDDNKRRHTAYRTPRNVMGDQDPLTTVADWHIPGLGHIKGALKWRRGSLRDMQLLDRTVEGHSL